MPFFFFCGNWWIDPKIHMEIEGTQHRQNNLAKEQYIVLALWFQSRIWFELIFVCGVSQGVYSFAYGFRLSWVCKFPESWWFYQLKLHNVWKLNQVQCLNSYFGLDVQISESRVSLAPRMIVGLRVLPRVSLWRHGTASELVKAWYWTRDAHPHGIILQEYKQVK